MSRIYEPKLNICEKCFYDTNKGCMIYHERQKNCSSKADREEAQRREEAVKEYKSISKPIKCEPVKEKLQKHFLRLHLEGYNDVQISEILGTSHSSVNRYRQNLGIKAKKKRKKEPAGTGK